MMVPPESGVTRFWDSKSTLLFWIVLAPDTFPQTPRLHICVSSSPPALSHVSSLSKDKAPVSDLRTVARVESAM